MPAQNITNKKTADDQLVNENNNNAKENSVKESLTKDADKNVAPQSFNVQKNSKIVLSKNAIKANLAQENNNGDWADPAKQGYTKTTAGWTKLKQGKDYDAVAKKSSVDFFSNTFGQNRYPTNNDLYTADSGQHDLFGDYSATISKNDLIKDHKILIGAIPILSNNDKVHDKFLKTFGWRSYDVMNNTNNTKIGAITTSVNSNSSEYDVYFTVTSDDKFANDLSFDYVVNNTPSGAYWASNYSDYIPVNSSAQVVLVTPQNKNINLTFHKSNFTEKWQDEHLHNSDAPLGIEQGYKIAFIHGLWYPTKSFSISDKSDLYDAHVIKLSSSNPADKLTASNSAMFNYAYLRIYNFDNKVLNNATRDDIGFKGSQAADNLTAQELFNATPDHEYRWSTQKDGSLLFAYKLHLSDSKHDLNSIEQKLKGTTWYHNTNNPDKDKIVQHSIDLYKARNGMATTWDLMFYFLPSDTHNPTIYTATDVTPNTDKHMGDGQASFTPDGAISLDMSMYRTYSIQYRDEVTGKLINEDSVSKSTGETVDYSSPLSNGYTVDPDQQIIKGGVYDPTTAKMTGGKEIPFTVDSTGLHFTFVVPKSEKIKPDPIIINVVSKDDYERSRTYHLVVKEPDHKGYGNTVDKAYDNFTLTMHRDINQHRGSDGKMHFDKDTNGKPTFGDWQISVVNDADKANKKNYTFTNGQWVSSTGEKLTDLLFAGKHGNYSMSDFNILGYTVGSDIAIKTSDGDINSTKNPTITIDNGYLKFTDDSMDPDKLPANDTTFYVTYTANKQSMTYKFVDDDEKQAPVGSDIVLNGVTDQLIDTGLTLPANYKLADGNVLPTSYQFSTTNALVTIHLKHVTTPITDPTVLIGTSTRTFHVHYPEGRDDETIVQIIKMNRTGKFDHVLNKPLYTDWVVDHDDSKVTVNNNKSDLYQAYTMDGKAIMFAPITLSRIPGYTAKVVANSIQPNVYLVSFVANTAPQKPIDAHNAGETTKPDSDKDSRGETIKPDDTKISKGEIAKPDDTKTNKGETIPNVPAVITPKDDDNKQAPDWIIKDTDDDHYTVSNNENTYNLPVIKNSSLAVIKTGTTTLAFTYVKFNQPNNCIFMITKRRKMYQLTVSKFDDNGNLNVVKVFKSHNYKNLLGKIKLYA